MAKKPTAKPKDSGSKVRSLMMPNDLHAKIDKIAKEESRTWSNALIVLVREALERREK